MIGSLSAGQFQRVLFARRQLESSTDPIDRADEPDGSPAAVT